MPFSLGKNIIENISRVMVGKNDALELLLVALLADGHMLLEDVPGVGKTLITKSLAKSIKGTFKRIQFTPDLMPADITGFNVYDQKSAQFKFQSGPVFAHILLADEINRTIPRTQSVPSREHGRASGDYRRPDLPAAETVFRVSYSEPHRTRGNLSPARGATGSVFA